MKIDLSSFRHAFLEEAAEHVAALEKGLLILETSPQDTETLNAVFRAVHSTKGAAGSLGFTDIANFTHTLETLLDRMRQGMLSVSTERISLLLKSVDELRILLNSIDSTEPISDAIAQLTLEIERGSDGATAFEAKQTVVTSAQPGLRRVRITLEPSPDFFLTGLEPLLLFRDLAKLGTLEGVVADVSRIPALDAMDPEKCYLAFTSILHTNAPLETIREVFVFVEDCCRVTLSDNETSAVDRRIAPRPQEGSPDTSSPRNQVSTLRVTSDKVDALINLVGELVIAQSMVRQLIGVVPTSHLPALQDAVATLEHNTQELQARVMAIRMVPVATVFGKFQRIVRDVAQSLGKDVTLEISGEETEIDKGVVERLSDPLTHLVRNSLDHGLESPEERVAQGKSRQGTLRLSAMHAAGGIVVEVSDDGRGLDTAKIRAKAEARGLVRPGDTATDEQIHSLIFEPGFSTADSVTDISGRGVGMDVVKRTVDGLNGSLSVATSPGHGTTLRVKLPLTLAILDGLTLGVGSQRFIVPLLAVTESLRPLPKEYKRIAGQGEIILVRGQPLPLIRLHEVFDVAGAQLDPTNALVVVVESDARRVGLVVDSLLGQAQVVLKSIETHYQRVDGVLGATILGDGQVSLILDVTGLVKMASRPPDAVNRVNAA